MKARYFAIAASALLFAACGGNAEDHEAAADSAMAPAPIDVPAPMDTSMVPPMDTGMVDPMDTTGMPMDTATVPQ